MKILKLAYLLAIMVVFSCSKDDDSPEQSTYPRTVNLKFEAQATPENFGWIDVVINNEIERSDELPFNVTIAQKEVERGTFLKMEYYDTPGSRGNEYPYKVNLSMYENNSVIAEKELTVTGEWQKG